MGGETRANWIGAPEFFNLNQACEIIWRAFDGANFCGVYLVGSALECRGHRDVDIRCILNDETFDEMFPRCGSNTWLNAKWSLLCSSISAWLAARSGLKIDFQFQRMTDANREFTGQPRCAIGLFYDELQPQTLNGDRHG